MDAFSYLSVLLSIIIGLGVTQVLTATGRLIRHRDRVRFDWLPILWAMIMLVVFVQVWWTMFGLRNVRKWTFTSFLLVLAQTCTLYMMAALVLPENVEGDVVDLAAHYERQRKWFFAFFIATLVVSVTKDLVINGGWPAAANLGFHVVLGVMCLSAIMVRGRRFQEVMGAVAALLMGAYIGLLFMRLQ